MSVFVRCKIFTLCVVQGKYSETCRDQPGSIPEALQLKISFRSSRIIMFNTNAACTEKCLDHLCFPHLLATARGLYIRFTLNGFSHILVMVLVLFLV